MNNDPFTFTYDEDVIDPNNDVKISVTVCGLDDDSIQLNLFSGALRIPFFLGPAEAALLGTHLLQAVKALQESSETVPD